MLNNLVTLGLRTQMYCVFDAYNSSILLSGTIDLWTLFFHNEKALVK